MVAADEEIKWSVQTDFSLTPPPMCHVWSLKEMSKKVQVILGSHCVTIKLAATN